MSTLVETDVETSPRPEVYATSERVLVVDLQSTSPVWALPPSGAALLRASAPRGWRVEVLQSPTVSDGDGNEAPSAESVAAVGGAEVYFGFGISRPLFAAGSGLRWVHSAAAGVGSALFPEMMASRVLFTNSAGVHAVPIAEHVTAGVLCLLRGFDIALDAQRAGRWDRAPFVRADTPVRELGECRALVVGAGGIGAEVARRLAAFGAYCVGLRRRPARGVPPGFARVNALDALDEELPGADILVLCAPLTPTTRGLLSARRLARLPTHAIVVNVGRGALLDEEALAAQVRSGRLRGAVLDVFEREPLASASALWQLRSVLVTPHVSAISPRRFWERELELFLDNWRRYQRGEPLKNLVDKQAGY
ncbi:MAG TPA: D-2-hydroxyacid dehydrogenase [Gemmatimonadaceae bacterium]|nr:D-2-hydroxyacid dehydrogenase [Gemmatimonadaceae bacterium]